MTELPHVSGLEADYDKLRTENKRLRGALRDIVGITNGGRLPMTVQVNEIACEALKEPDDV